MQVVVSGALDYSKPEVQKDMEDLLSRLENTTYIDPLYTESWLRSFLDYVERWKDYPDYYELEIGDEQSFIKALKNVSIRMVLVLVLTTLNNPGGTISKIVCLLSDVSIKEIKVFRALETLSLYHIYLPLAEFMPAIQDNNNNNNNNICTDKQSQIYPRHRI